MGTGRYSSWDVELKNHRHLVLRLKVGGDIPPLTRKPTGHLQVNFTFTVIEKEHLPLDMAEDPRSFESCTSQCIRILDFHQRCAC